jgi:hypothetical protein
MSRTDLSGKKLLVTMVVLVVMLALPLALHAQSTDPASVVITSVNTCSAGDVDASLATFADDAVVYILIPGAPETHTGQEEIRAWLEDLVAQHWEGEVEILGVEGDKVTSRLTSYMDPTRALGVAPLVGMEEYIVQDGKITAYTWTITDESLAKLQAAMATLPETGGLAFPTYAPVLVLGSLGILVGIGLALLRRRSLQG